MTMNTLTTDLLQAPAAAAVLDWPELLERRKDRFHLRPRLRVRTEDAALAFLNDVGLAFLFSGMGLPLPNLWDAINGGARPIPDHHHDHALGLTWNWKDSLPARKAIWYGKLIKQKPTFVSLDLLPAFYALSTNFGELDDYLEQYADGRLSADARTVYAALLQNGPSSTNALRRATNLLGKGDVARRFERAVAELQADLKIVKCGIAEDNRWKYCYVYDVLLRWHPALAEQARALTGRQAMAHIITRYLRTVVAAPPPGLAALFGWEARPVELTLAHLREQGTLRDLWVRGIPADQRPRTGAKKPTAPGDELWVTLQE